MMRTTHEMAPPRRPLAEREAGEVMTPDPKTIRDDATVEEAVAFLVDTGYSAAPVVDEAGRPVGVISRTDLVVYERARLPLLGPGQEFFESAGPGATIRETAPVRVADLMNPEVFSVTPDFPVSEVAARMVALNVHRLFVVEDDGSLVGVISALDLLAHLPRSGRS
jgi:CBS domain-containing protein